MIEAKSVVALLIFLITMKIHENNKNKTTRQRNKSDIQNNRQILLPKIPPSLLLRTPPTSTRTLPNNAILIPIILRTIQRKITRKKVDVDIGRKWYYTLIILAFILATFLEYLSTNTKSSGKIYWRPLY